MNNNPNEEKAQRIGKMKTELRASFERFAHCQQCKEDKLFSVKPKRCEDCEYNEPIAFNPFSLDR